MSKFTEGPWYVSKPKGEHRAFVMADGMRICTVAHNSGKTSANSNAALITSAPDLYEEDEQRSRLIGEVYILLLQGQTKEAIDLIYEQEVINFTDGPMAVSPALAKARGEL